MATSSEPSPEQTEISTQDLPTIPPTQEMKTWNMEKVRRWIKQRDQDVLMGNDLENFTKAGIRGRAFLASSVQDFQTYGLPLAVAVALKDLADEVKEGKFTLWT
jgi:hypothetical protein